ncbi:ribosomal protein S18-alanine N-acetyltransferase [Streptococcus himalayensis]|uniref:[Ribosomal protein bS18]-alanine N-acetyltransferase n=1 Tax=Streptococcus himalayensis TaxID=1888195 RepID=A0A917ECP8_9STRE|nr:ribosomal protein S18-alanine N-acetyltransferase [Streptococcus himalayensis]GGE24602.1 ribosomal-protein-alanine acetyltransferase [Streptococcus himalayensis]
MIELQILDGQQGDWAGKIHDLLLDVYDVSPWTVEQIASDLENPLTQYTIALENARVVGFLAIQESDFEVEILHIAVRKAYQGRGLARQLFSMLPQQKEIFLEVRASNSPALRFYQKEEFTPIARRKNYYHAPMEDAIIMKREPNER